jgi:UDP-3-O-[3-hydroxymyristoyl] N-acetylglucosamine deacetylase
MDGLPETFRPTAHIQAHTAQRTLKSAIACVGTGLHSGHRVNLGLHPSPIGTGIVFRRTDLGLDIPATWNNVQDTRLCTMLALPGHSEARIGTVEHIMAALYATGIDNAVVTLDGPEVPVLDGSAAPFVFLIDCAGTVEQSAPRQIIEVLRRVRVEDRQGYAELRPYAHGLDLSLSIDFAAEAIGRQAYSLSLSDTSFRRCLSQARTFTQLHEIEAMQAAGLARGGSLSNAIVVDGSRVLNPEGLRMPEEFVRHKLLDAVGDLALCGAQLLARFTGHRSGHAMNNNLLRALFADESAWQLVSAEPISRAAYATAKAA